MKKKFLFLFLLLIIFIPKDTFALSNSDTYVANDGITYNVDISNSESVLDYYFFNYIYTLQNYENYNFCLGIEDAVYRFYFTESTQFTFIDYSNNRTRISSGTTAYYIDSNNGTLNNTTAQVRLQAFPKGNNTNGLYYSTFNLEYNSSVSFFANITASDILSRYIQPEEPEEPPPPEDMSKEDIYNGLQQTAYVGLVLLATLILMLFFKWCFPFRSGGRKL